ncbi:hypothetical protein IWQ60_002543 [Tieghemiomyces parasiticus]|uniref:Integral membrane bound transporter domain-containing protein n=1 Tax=Tieghemiomyces parasiticus TaxID=78921 RepID=A0A9W8AIW6_9FUNG|nr:hypothetical protein IWQ60_002543 [Tieghemiomyces parasiticus]
MLRPPSPGPDHANSPPFDHTPTRVLSRSSTAPSARVSWAGPALGTGHRSRSIHATDEPGATRPKLDRPASYMGAPAAALPPPAPSAPIPAAATPTPGPGPAQTPFLTLPRRHVLKAALAFIVASLFSFHPALQAIVGNSPHLVANAVLFFNPVRSRGAFIESGAMGVLGLIYSAVLGYLSLCVATALVSYEGLVITSKVISLVVFIFIPIFVLAYVKANLGRPAIYTGNSIAHIMLLIVLTQETPIVHFDGVVDPKRAEDNAAALLMGLVISFLIGWFLWPQRAHTRLQRSIHGTIDSCQHLLHEIVDVFILDGWSIGTLPNGADGLSEDSVHLALLSPTPEARTRSTALAGLLQKHRQSFTTLEKALDEARPEVSEYHAWRMRSLYASAVRSLNQLSQHLGGIYSGVDTQIRWMRRDLTTADTPPPTPTGVTPSSASTGAILTTRQKNELVSLIEFIAHVQPTLVALTNGCQMTFSSIRTILDASFQARPDDTAVWAEVRQQLTDRPSSPQPASLPPERVRLPSQLWRQLRQITSQAVRDAGQLGEPLFRPLARGTTYGTLPTATRDAGGCPACFVCRQCGGRAVRPGTVAEDIHRSRPCTYALLRRLRVHLIANLECFNAAYTHALSEMYHRRPLWRRWHDAYTSQPEPMGVPSSSAPGPPASSAGNLPTPTGRPPSSASLTSLWVAFGTPPADPSLLSSSTASPSLSPRPGEGLPEVGRRPSTHVGVPSPLRHTTEEGLSHSMHGSEGSSLSRESSTHAALGSHPYEHLFTVYFFVFSIQEFAAELLSLLRVTENIVAAHPRLGRAGGCEPLGATPDRGPAAPCECDTPVDPHQPASPCSPASLIVKPGGSPGMPGGTEIDAAPVFVRTPTQRSLGASLRHGPSLMISAVGNFLSWLFRPPSEHREWHIPASELDPPGLHNPVPATRDQAVRYRLWRFFLWFRWFQTKYAIKAGTVATLLALPAFVESWNPTFRAFRGEWSAITALVVMTPTVGGSNITSVYRVLGTVVGGLVAYLVFLLCDETYLPVPSWLVGLYHLLLPSAAWRATLAHLADTLVPFPILFPVTIFLVTLPGFHLLLNSKFPKVGQYSLITFSVVLHNKVKGGEDADVPIGSLAMHRTTAVLFGVVVGLLATIYIWPFEARVEVRRGLSDLFINMSLLYDKLVSTFSLGADLEPLPASHGASRPVTLHRPPPPPRRPTAAGSDSSDDDDAPWQHSSLTVYAQEQQWLEPHLHEFMEMELSLQKALLGLQILLNDTAHEPRLKGPYPSHVYQRMFRSCQVILDKFVAVRGAVTKQMWQLRRLHHVHQTSTPPSGLSRTGGGADPGRVPDSAGETLGRRDRGPFLSPMEAFAINFMHPCRRERVNMVGCSLLYFYILASACLLKTPLPPFLPPLTQAHRKLVEKMRQLDQQHRLRYQRRFLNAEQLPTTTGPTATNGGPGGARHAEDEAYEVHHLFYYAQAVLFGDIVRELESLGACMVELFGCYGGKELRHLQAHRTV